MNEKLASALGYVDEKHVAAAAKRKHKRPKRATNRGALFDWHDGEFYCSRMQRATWTPLAEAWDREWVMPLPSPMM